MTRLFVASDLHSNHAGNYMLPRELPEFDIAIIAGDVSHTAQSSIQLLNTNPVLCKKPLIYVAGNHDYYDGVIEIVDKDAEEMSPSNSVFLQCKTYLDGENEIRIIGATLWTDYALFGPENIDAAMSLAKRGMNDHYFILTGGHVFDPSDALTIHIKHREYIRSELEKPFFGKTVVVTHHCPHPMSIDPRYATNALTAAFCSDLSKMMDEYGPDLWIHGHTHTSFDYTYGKTRVVCNPKGYRNENPRFNPHLVLEI